MAHVTKQQVEEVDKMCAMMSQVNFGEATQLCTIAARLRLMVGVGMDIVSKLEGILLAIEELGAIARVQK